MARKIGVINRVRYLGLMLAASKYDNHLRVIYH